jgi:FKBP-type peptidyl-prolyl cis-trans isomerase 2
VKRTQDGSVAPARSRTPVVMTVGVDHPRLPGLGLALVGLTPGAVTKVRVPAGQGHAPADPARVRRWARTRFAEGQPLLAGAWVAVSDAVGRRRLVRVVEAGARTVVVDTNPRWAGRALELEVQLIDILTRAPGPDRQRIVAFDVDPASLASLRQAFPGWTVEAVNGATTASLDRDWDPGAASLMVIGAREEVAQTLGLCRGLRGQAGRARTPLLVLVRSAQEPLVRAALDASADSCLVLPVHPKELVAMVIRALAGNRPGHHTLGLDRPQRTDPLRDEGGEA